MPVLTRKQMSKLRDSNGRATIAGEAAPREIKKGEELQRRVCVLEQRVTRLEERANAEGNKTGQDQAS